MESRAFPRASGKEGAAGHVMVLDSNKHDYDTAARIAREGNGRFGTRTELVREASSPDGFEALKGNTYWMGGLFWMRTGYYKVDAETGEFTRVSEAAWRLLRWEERAVAYDGKGPFAAAMRINDRKDVNGDDEHCKYEILQNPTILAAVAIVGLPGPRRA